MFQPTNAQEVVYNHHVVNDIESESITVNPTTITDEAASADADAPTSNDLICGFSKKTMVAVGSGLVLIGAGAVAGTAAAAYSTQQPITTIQQSKAATGSKSGKKSKAGKKVCLQDGFLNDVIVAGSPVNIAGKSGPKSCALPNPTGACCTESMLCCATPDSCGDVWETPACTAYLACLGKPENGPVFVKPWWINRDVEFGGIEFVEDAVCARFNTNDGDNKARLELWDSTYLDMDLAQFKEFSVDYDIVTAVGSSAYVNMYVRSSNNMEWYDCRFTYDTSGSSGTLRITPDTEMEVKGRGPNAASPCPTTGGTSNIAAYIAANPNAVMGVGNGELYTFALNNGSTVQNNNGLDACWSNVSFTRKDAGGDIYVDNYEFTTLD